MNTESVFERMTMNTILYCKHLECILNLNYESRKSTAQIYRHETFRVNGNLTKIVNDGGEEDIT